MGGEEQAATSADDVVVSDGAAVNMNVQVNGFLAEAEKVRTTFANPAGSLGDDLFALRGANFGGSSGDSFRTYKRRKRAQAEDRKLSGNAASQIEEKPAKELPDILANKDASQDATVAGALPLIGMNASYDCLVKQRNVVLQQMCESQDDEAGLVKCIRDALVLHSESGCTSAVKELIHSCEDGTACTSLSGPVRSQFQNEARCIESVTLNGSVNDKNYRTVTELCQQTFLNAIMSENFSILCNILFENFQEMRVDKFFDIACINSRMKEGAYEKSPRLFYSDIQQFWVKLQKIGSDIASLANHLSEKSRAAYQEQVGSSLHDYSLDAVVEFVTKESDTPSKVEQTEGCGTYKSVTCKHCNGKTDGGDFLVCDLCEAVYHVSCIDPAVKTIPLKCWYCASCTKKGILSPHDDCVICEKIYASRSSSTMNGIDPLNNAETLLELERRSNGLMEDDQLSKEGKEMPRCNICKTDVQIGEKLKVCGHSFCPHKVYHARCLTSKQLKSYGPCWYCPSCMCRVCLTDRDDEKIVMCDACDHAYHIYCLKPPRTMIPRGKWFCTNCEKDIRRIREAKRKYEKSLRKQPEVGKASSHDGRIEGKGKKQEPFDKSGAEMLLNAAIALTYEENLAAMGRYS